MFLICECRGGGQTPKVVTHHLGSIHNAEVAEFGLTRRTANPVPLTGGLGSNPNLGVGDF